MARGLFTLKQQLQGVEQSAWNTPVGTYAGSFNGSSQSLSVASNAAFAYGTGDFTWEMWIYGVSSNWTNSDYYFLDHGVDGGTIEYYNRVRYYNPTTGNSSPLYTTSAAVIPVSTWTHLAITRASNTTRIFINGNLIVSATDNHNYSAQAVSIASRGAGGASYYFPGYISNLRLIKGTAAYTASFSPPAAPLAAITNTSLLTLQNSTIIDNSTNAFTITNNGSVTTGAAMPFTQLKTPAVDYLVVAGGGSGAGQSGAGGGAGGLLQGSVPVTAGSSITVTVGAGGNAVSGAGNVGNNSAFSSISASGGGGGQTLNGGTGGSGGSGGGANLGPSDIAGFGGQGVFGQGNKGGNSGTRNGQALGAGGGGAGTVGLDTVPASGIPGNGGAGISSAISGTVTAYAGGGGGSGTGGGVTATGGVGGGGAGAPCGPSGTTGTAGTTNTGGGGGAGSFGAGVGAAGGSGIVILSYPDIYAGAAATTGSPTISTSGSGSIGFSGSSDANISFPNNSGYSFGTGDFTVEGWCYLTGTSGGGYMIDARNAATGSPWLIGSEYSAGAWKPLWYTTGGYTYSSLTFQPNTWNHIAVSRQSGTLRVFLNGAVGATAASSITEDRSSTIVIGNVVQGTVAFAGYLSNLRIVKGYALYTSAFTPSTTPLTAVTGTTLLLNAVSPNPYLDSSSICASPTTIATVSWNQASPFATGLGYKNRVYTYTGSGTITF